MAEDRPQWEYHYVSTSGALAPALKMLNEVGADGWEVVCLYQAGMLLKRPVVADESDEADDDDDAESDEIERLVAELDQTQRMFTAAVLSCGGRIIIPENLLVDDDWVLKRTDDPGDHGIVYEAERCDDNGNYLDDRDKVNITPNESLTTEALILLWRHTGSCPCGARREALDTHPHVAGCDVGTALDLVGDAHG